MALIQLELPVLGDRNRESTRWDAIGDESPFESGVVDQLTPFGHIDRWQSGKNMNAVLDDYLNFFQTGTCPEKKPAGPSGL